MPVIINIVAGFFIAKRLCIWENIGMNDVIKQLQALRDTLAEELKTERFKVLTQNTIQEIAKHAPQTVEELLQIKGIGKKKAAQFGARILEIVHGQRPASLWAMSPTPENQIPSQPSPSERGRERVKKEKIFRVSEFLDVINEELSSQYVLVHGEITGFQSHPTGAYFSLKDAQDGGIMNCYMRPWAYRSLGFSLDDGMEIKIGGALEIYKPKGRLSFQVDTVMLAGEGSLRKAYELLKQKLDQEGLFRRKRPLPECVKTIGVITSRMGAVIDDFRKNLEPRGFRIYFHDARVEGVRAVPDVIQAIRWFNLRMPSLDVLVIIRGGGSLEDLQAFNNELVARELFASSILTICGIGHDRDIPIASMVADREVSTPSVAAMIINNSWTRLRQDLPAYAQHIMYAYERTLEGERFAVRHANEIMLGYIRSVTLHFRSLTDSIAHGALKTESMIREIAEKQMRYARIIVRAIEVSFQRARKQCAAYESYLALADPQRNLKLGYSILFNKKGRVVKWIKDVVVDEEIVSRLADGEIISTVTDKRGERVKQENFTLNHSP